MVVTPRQEIGVYVIDETTLDSTPRTMTYNGIPKDGGK